MTVPTRGRATRLPAGMLTAVLAVFLCCATAARGEEPREPPDEEAQAAELIAAFKAKDPTVRVEALAKAAANQHASLTAPLIRLLSERELGVRLAAIEALAARTDKKARRKAAAAMGSRLARLSKGRADPEELLLVIDSLGSLGQPSAVKHLLEPIKLDTDVEEMKARIQAVGNIPHEAAVEGLIDFIAKGRRGGRQGQRREAHSALVRLTGGTPRANRTAGHDADRWRAWWKDNKKTCDLEAVAVAREEAAAEKAAKAERRKKKQEERKKKQAEAKKKRAERGSKGESKPAPKKPPRID